MREGNQYLDPTLASLSTGMEKDEIIGFITSVFSGITQREMHIFIEATPPSFYGAKTIMPGLPGAATATGPHQCL